MIVQSIAKRTRTWCTFACRRRLHAGATTQLHTPYDTNTTATATANTEHIIIRIFAMVSSVRLTLFLVCTAQAAFIAPSSRGAFGTKLGFGFNGLGSPKPDNEEGADKPEKKIGAAGLLQLITAGMGAPFLGDYQGVDEVSDRVMVISFVCLCLIVFHLLIVTLILSTHH